MALRCRLTAAPLLVAHSSRYADGPSCFLLQDQLPPVRRLAELHYKASLVLQFSHKAEPARQHTEVRVAPQAVSRSTQGTWLRQPHQSLFPYELTHQQGRLVC